MNRNQVKGSSSETKTTVTNVSGKVSGDKSTEHRGKAEKHGSKDGAVLSDINGEATKTTKSTRKETK